MNYIMVIEVNPSDILANQTKQYTAKISNCSDITNKNTVINTMLRQVNVTIRQIIESNGS